VALQATTSNILDSFLTMLVHHLILLMTLETIHRSIGSVVATRAPAIGVTVPHWEGMAINTDITPVVGVVALGALTGPVIGRARMAGLAITLATMIEISWLPGVGRVAVRTLSLEVVVRPVVARLAIRKTIVIKVRPSPGIG
jgi:hypothetical protein